MKYIEVERRNPTQAELQDPTILVGDVGMELNPNKNNYDHHQDKELPCALALVYREGTEFLEQAQKIIVHGGFVAHFDEIYMVAFLDTMENELSHSPKHVQELIQKISVWDTMGPNEYKKRYPEDVPEQDSFRNFLQIKWAKNPNDAFVRQAFLTAFLETNGTLSHFLKHEQQHAYYPEYQNWLQAKEQEKAKMIETLDPLGIDILYTKKRNKVVVLMREKPLSDMDGLPDQFYVLEHIKEKFDIEPEIMLSLTKDRDDGRNICSIFRTGKGEEAGIDLTKIQLGEDTIFCHKAGFVHNIEISAIGDALDQIINLF
jgi:hypothetical protein